MSVPALALVLGIAVQAAHLKESKINLIRTPNGGIQPQAAVEGKGTLHLIYFSGEPAAGDIFYVRRPAGEADFSKPVRVNSQPGSAIAVGTIRGAQLAVARNGRVHVCWRGSKTAIGLVSRQHGDRRRGAGARH